MQEKREDKDEEERRDNEKEEEIRGRKRYQREQRKLEKNDCH